jgi:hypothetical protein
MGPRRLTCLACCRLQETNVQRGTSPFFGKLGAWRVGLRGWGLRLATAMDMPLTIEPATSSARGTINDATQSATTGRRP